jgi:thermitase
MRNSYLVLFAALAMLVGFSASGGDEARAHSESAEGPTYSEDSGREFDPGKIIVKLEEDATPRDLRELNRENNARTEEDLPRSDVNVIDLPSDTTVQEGIEAYEDSPDVEYAEPDFLLEPTATPNDPFYKD